MSNHAAALNQIVQSYGLTPQLITALEVYVKTAEDNALRHAKQLQAEDVCEGLHTPPAVGLKCMKCYMAEHHFAEEAVVESLIESKKSGAAQADGE